MDIVRGYGTRPRWQKTATFCLLMAVCIGINFCGAFFAKLLGLPLYLDCIGTMLASMLGGYISGIFVGLFSSILNGIFSDPRLVSYGALNVFIAIFTAWACTHKWFKKPLRFFTAAIIYAFLGGFLGSILTIVLYGFGNGVASGSVVYWFSDMGMPRLLAEMLGDYCVDILDKFISLTIAVFVCTVMPKQIRGKFKIHSWKQTPLKSDAVQILLSNKTRGRSLRNKIIFVLILMATLIAIVSISISYALFVITIEAFAKREGVVVPNFVLEIWSEKYLVNQLSLFIGVFIFIIVLFLYIARYHLILPLNSMAYTLGYYSDKENRSFEEMAKVFDGLRIHTGDETENLYICIADMIKESANYLADIQHKNATISDMQNAMIIVLADIVESRDHNTGNHIKTTAEYVELIIDEMLFENIYQDQLTSKFISDVYQSAPLHDIGKISVSDVILNKPGKLTDEEFDLMKKHTIEGAKIIDKVIDTVPDSDNIYLKEARDLALYHHERWDGTGYPYGIAGEEIPLSARIMAVADVFDALVSKRSYKEAYDFDKAISIIEESAGTHFDPLIVKAFINAKEKIRIITEEKDSIND